MENMLPENKIISGLWIGGTLGEMQKLCIHSYLHHGHIFYLYVYDKIKNIPENVVVKDANEILPASNIFKDKHDSYGAFANWFRIELLYKTGGWWVDMDTVCLQPFDFNEEHIFASELKEGHAIVANSYIKAPANSIIIGKCREAILQKTNLQDSNWGELGAWLLIDQVYENNLWEYVAEPNVFNPIPHNYWEIFFSDVLIDFTDATYAVHLWNDMRRRKNLDTNADFPTQSFYERVKKKYLLGNTFKTPIILKES